MLQAGCISMGICAGRNTNKEKCTVKNMHLSLFFAVNEKRKHLEKKTKFFIQNKFLNFIFNSACRCVIARI